MKGFFATAGMSLKQSRYFGLANLIGNYGLKLLGTLFMLLIWKTIFESGADTGGMQLSQLMTYTLLTSILSPLLDVRTPISSWLHEGTLLSLYERPMGILRQLTATTVGGWGTHLACYSLPLLLVMPLLGGSWNAVSVWFPLSLLLSVVQGFCVDFLFGCLIVRAKNMSWQIESLRGALTALLTGAVIPFSLLPWGIGDVLALSPFGTLAGAPLALFTGLDTAARLIPAQLLWTAVLLPVSGLCFKKSTERMISYGG